ncbi:aldo/keto reductase [Mucilaginibacter sp. Bleaf8]|uniref:aldo/keto reductase n=1 Tax=Mucilaginibacter sp. Bleaf8 TaxID=2834430 RepID=UPI001BCD08C9|nr:aldo/keto reductase [Mucilaginibacter sp. Bleaf8]MBS7564881.1 aldo/keto reductase [Mucilaginibacter sp. Bleaf8]
MTSDISISKIIFGTSSLGNLYTALDDSIKLEIVKQIIQHSPKPAVFDSAGKYGAGLALESLGKALHELQIKPEDVLISNKLGWYRTELKTPEPTFEPGVWRDLKYDAVQKISYEGILACYEQGNQLLHGYNAQLVSVHDPDEYLAAAENEAEREKRYQDVLDAYRALAELKQQGRVKAIGVGAKDWTIIRKITDDIHLDWVMIANSMTLHSHPKDLLKYMQSLQERGIMIINSAVFNAGFLIGGNYYNYKEIDPESDHDQALLKWRERFFALCDKHAIKPAEACVQFGLSAPGVVSIALSTTNAGRVKQNVAMGHTKVPNTFWQDMKAGGLMDSSYNYV